MEIPVYRRQNTIPAKTGGVMVSPEKVAEPYRAEAKIGETISNIGFKAAELNNQYMAAEKRAERTLEAQKLENALKNDFADAQLTIDQTGDYKQFETITNSKIAELKKKHIDSIQDPIVRRAGELVFSTLSGNLSRHAKVQKATLMTEESTNLWEVDYGRSVDAYARETDPTRKAVIKDTLRIKGLELEDAHMMKQGATELAMFKFEQDTAKLEEAYKKDAESALTQKEVEAKEAIKLSREATGNEFVSRLVSGKLTRADVLKSNLEPTGENGKQYWINQIEQMEKKVSGAITGGGDGFKTDKILDGKLYGRIVTDPESVSEKEIISYIGNGLSRTTAEHLIDERRQRLNPQKDPARTAAESAVVENLKRDRKEGIFGSGQAGDLEYAKQVDSFRRWSKAHPDDDPSEYYEKVMEPVKKSFIFDFLKKDKPEPKARREEMEQTGEIPQRRVTDKKVADPLRDQAITILNQNKKPVTEANIEYVKKQLGSK
jgi:hypothetical protein